MESDEIAHVEHVVVHQESGQYIDFVVDVVHHGGRLSGRDQPVHDGVDVWHPEDIHEQALDAGESIMATITKSNDPVCVFGNELGEEDACRHYRGEHFMPPVFDFYTNKRKRAGLEARGFHAIVR